MIHPVILCGGSGTRLWPASRAAFPKQFAPLVGDESLYQATLRRFAGGAGIDFAAPVVMTGDAFRFLATEQARAIGLADAEIVVEPAARDTAPAVLAAARLIGAPDALMLVAPSDHLIDDVAAFLAAVGRGAEAAAAGALVTFGVVPDRAETGYGYLELERAPAGDGAPVPLAGFREKPGPEEAAAMTASGRHLWNAGIFLHRVGDVTAAFEAHAPDLVPPVAAAVAQAAPDLGFRRLGAAYAEARAISIDYAVMERARPLAAVPLDCGWTDLGAWDALWQRAEKGRDGVAAAGAVTAIDCRDSYLRSDETSVRLVGLGLDRVIAVAMRDAVLVADMDRAQEVKEVVATLRRAEATQADDYPRFHRPWGWYETLIMGGRFQVKRIMVRPGGVLSLQSHMHRSEHWIVVGGTAEVTIGAEVRLVSENQSVYIPLGERHRMANPGRVPMYLIEVQTGAYLGEDDIVRYEDVYGRG